MCEMFLISVISATVTSWHDQDVAFLSKLRADQGPPASTREGMNSAGWASAIQSISTRPPWAECRRQEINRNYDIITHDIRNDMASSTYFMLICLLMSFSWSSGHIRAHQVIWRHMMSLLGWIPKCFQAFPCDLAPGFASLELKSYDAHILIRVSLVSPGGLTCHSCMHFMHGMLLYWSSTVAR